MNRSSELFSRAQQSIPGGVNSPVRAFKSVGGTPIFIKKAKGAYLYDEDDKRYIDFINSWGPMILGHAYEPLVNAIQEKVKDSTSFGAPTELEIKVAELIKVMAPNIDLVRMVNSGTEACMSAIRLARGYTGRNKFIKFEGCYHGHADSFLVKAGSGVATLGIQAVPGVTEGVAIDTLTAPYNNIAAVKKLVAAQYSWSFDHIYCCCVTVILSPQGEGSAEKRDFADPSSAAPPQDDTLSLTPNLWASGIQAIQLPCYLPEAGNYIPISPVAAYSSVSIRFFRWFSIQTKFPCRERG